MVTALGLEDFCGYANTQFSLEPVVSSGDKPVKCLTPES